MMPIVVFVLLIFLFGLVSRRLERTIITAPMVFTTAGILLVLALAEPDQLQLEGHTVLLVSEVALALVLFTDATRMRVRSLLGSAQLPGRLLGIGMPLTILLGAVAAVLLLTDLSVWEAAVLAVILAPTDAGLGQVVVNSPRVPMRIRQALNVEAGLNDGLSVPLLMLFIALAQVNQPLQDRSWLVFASKQIGFGLMVGLAFGWAGGWLIGQATRRGWMEKTFQQLALLSLALMCWLVSEEIDGNAFIAAYIGGLVVKASFEEAGEQMVEFMEAWGQLLNFFVFFLFGMLVATSLYEFNAAVVLYALLSLTLIRMLPVAISLIGTGLKPASMLFLGWFGPRGLASIVLGLIFLKEKAPLPGEQFITLTVSATVLLSVFAHGISAAPVIDLYARQLEGMDADAPERAEVVAMPTRTYTNFPNEN